MRACDLSSGLVRDEDGDTTSVGALGKAAPGEHLAKLSKVRLRLDAIKLLLGDRLDYGSLWYELTIDEVRLRLVNERLRDLSADLLAVVLQREGKEGVMLMPLLLAAR